MKKYALSIFTLTLLAASIQANATMKDNDHSGFYLGASLGNMTLENTAYSSEINSIAKSTGIDTSPSAMGYGVYGGYNVNKWFGLEANLSFSNGFESGNTFIKGEGDAISITLAPKFTYHINDFISFYGKVGIAYVSADGSAKLIHNKHVGYRDAYGNVFAESDSVKISSSGSGSGFGYTYGVGIEAVITKNLNFRLSYDFINADLDNSGSGSGGASRSSIAYNNYYGVTANAHAHANANIRADSNLDLSFLSVGLNYKF